MTAVLQVRDVTKSFGPGSGPGLTVLSGVSLELEAASSLVVMGPSGSGKSTLLNIVGTLDSPTSGTVLFEGDDVHAYDQTRAASFRNGKIGFVFQDHHLLPQCTALENVLLPCLAAGRVREEQVARARSLLDQVGMGDRQNHTPDELSGGQRQRVALARALVNEPRLLLCDEPTGNLDAATGEQIARLLLALRDGRDLAVLLVTHNAALARSLGRTARLEGGTLHA